MLSLQHKELTTIITIVVRGEEGEGTQGAQTLPSALVQQYITAFTDNQAIYSIHILLETCMACLGQA